LVLRRFTPMLEFMLAGAIKNFGFIYNLKDRSILSPSLDPSHQGREGHPLPLDGGGRVGVNGINLSPPILLWGAVCVIPAKAGIQSF